MDEFVFSYFLTIVIETAVLFLLLRQRYAPTLIARNAIIASTLTLPFVWFVFPFLGLGSWVLQTMLAEIFAVVAEAVVYQRLFAQISWKDAFLTSLLCNGISFSAGIILL